MNCVGVLLALLKFWNLLWSTIARVNNLFSFSVYFNEPKNGW
jgi:hypothetical protein